MYVIVPHAIDYAEVTSSLPEDPAPVWSAASTYAKGAVARVGTALYTSLTDNNRGNNPAVTSSGTEAAWRRSGASNRAALFDGHVHTQSVAPEETPLVVGVPWRRATGFAMLNISGAAQLTAVITAANGEVIAERTYDLLDGVDNWYDYFAYNFSFVRDVVELDLCGFLFGTLTLTLTGSLPAAGHLAVGDLHEPGATLYGAVAELINYSVVETNDFGVTEIVERVSAKRYECQLFLPPSRTDAVFDLFDKIRAMPCVWIGDNAASADGGHSHLTAFGLYTRARLTDEGPCQATYDMEITGLI